MPESADAALLRSIEGGLIVSCQAGPDDPLLDARFSAGMARSAAIGGAVGIRANGPADIAAIRGAVALPIVGIWKVAVPGMGIRITPAPGHARAVAAAGASIIALDATDRPRDPATGTLADLIRAVHGETGLPVMADIASLDEGLRAEDLGADLVATTLAGYTGGPVPDGPDLALVAALAGRLRVPLIAEGRIRTPAEAAEAIARGAFAVVVGDAITRPDRITARFVDALRG